MEIFIDHVFCHPLICIFLHEATKHTVDTLLNNSLDVSPFYCHFKVWACRVYFSNKTKWHNERMELSRLYLIEFDQVPAQCRSNLPRSTVVSLPGRQGRPINFEACAENLLAAPSALFMMQGLEHLQMACHFLLPSITMAICCTH